MSWVVLALLGFLCTGIGNFMMKLGTNAGQAPLPTLTLMMISNMAILAAIWLFKPPSFVWSTQAVLWPMLGNIILVTGVYFLISALAAPGSKTGIATALMNANFALVVLLSFVILKEALTLKQVIGLLAVLGGMVLLI